MLHQHIYVCVWSDLLDIATCEMSAMNMSTLMYYLPKLNALLPMSLTVHVLVGQSISLADMST